MKSKICISLIILLATMSLIFSINSLIFGLEYICNLGEEVMSIINNIYIQIGIGFMIICFLVTIVIVLCYIGIMDEYDGYVGMMASLITLTLISSFFIPVGKTFFTEKSDLYNINFYSKNVTDFRFVEKHFLDSDIMDILIENNIIENPFFEDSRITVNSLVEAIKFDNVSNWILNEEDIIYINEHHTIKDIIVKNQELKNSNRICDINHIDMEPEYCTECGTSKTDASLIYYGYNSMCECGHILKEFDDYCQKCGTYNSAKERFLEIINN